MPEGESVYPTRQRIRELLNRLNGDISNMRSEDPDEGYDEDAYEVLGLLTKHLSDSGVI